MIVKILGEGTVIMNICTNGEYRKVTLNNVLYVPDAAMRFFAPHKASVNNCVSEISQQHWKIMQKDQELITGYSDSSGLYWIKGTIIRNRDILAKISKNDYLLWHNRLRHPGKKIVENLHKGTKGLSGRVSIPSDISPCHGCQLGKSKRQPFPSSESRAKKSLDLIHCNLIEFPT